MSISLKDVFELDVERLTPLQRMLLHEEIDRADGVVRSAGAGTHRLVVTVPRSNRYIVMDFAYELGIECEWTGEVRVL